MQVYVHTHSKEQQQTSPKPETKSNQRNKENIKTLKKEIEKILGDRRSPSPQIGRINIVKLTTP